MDNVKAQSTLRQLFSLLPIDVQERLVFDHYTKKLTIMKSIFVFIAAQLNQWSSYAEMELRIRAHPELQHLLKLESISASQLSRKLDQIPTEMLQGLFQYLVKQNARQTMGHTRKNGWSNKLHIIDSSTIRLPLNLGDWAQMSKKGSGVKMHLRLMATSPDDVLPDAMIPTSLNVGDRKCAVELVTTSDAIYIMDRGYDDYKRMDKWVSQNILFVMRVRSRTATTILEEYSVAKSSKILRDAKVQVGSTSSSMENHLRLVEYLDDQGREYRVLTSVWEKSAEEIAEFYKARWYIELYFKWLKQHLRLKKLQSFKPQAIWNQLFLALITALLIEHMKSTMQVKKSKWKFLRLLRVYMYDDIKALEAELMRSKSRTTRGKPPGVGKKPISIRTTIGIVKTSKAKK